MQTSFKSYVVQAEKDEKLSRAIEKVYERPEGDIQDKMIPGEIAIGHAKKVIKCSVHDDPAKGTSGTLICTNYRVAFITNNHPTFDLVQLSNKLLGPEDVTLGNIDVIFVEYANKRKRLVPKSRVKEGIKRLELHLKDFRNIAFNFKLTAKGEEQGVIKAILHHAYPSTVSLLFALDFQLKLDVGKVCKTPMYRTSQDWERLLNKFHIQNDWRVTLVNQHYVCSETMGSHFIVPKSLSDHQLTEAANQFASNRLPMWCWTADSGCHLIRSTELRPEVELQEWEEKILSAIQHTDTKKRTFKIIDISKSCPSCIQVQQSYNKLRALCMPGSESEFLEADSHWFSQLHSTKWLHHVSSLLSLAVEASKWISNKEHHVVIKEHSGTDFTPILTCLTQLLLDVECRSIQGFQDLVQREWVVAGHGFTDRLGHLIQPSKHGANSVLNSDNKTSNLVSPLFLLFLDCVWQLTRQYPSSFEFSSTYLTVLHDNTRNPAFDSFIFNNERQRQRTLTMSDAKIETLPVWAWLVQFDDADRKLFNNPLYKWQRMSLLYNNLQIDEDSLSSSAEAVSLPPIQLSASMDSLELIDEESGSSSLQEGALTPTDLSPTHSGNSLKVHGNLESDQVYYNSRTGMMIVGGESLESAENKKKRRFSMRRKKAKEQDDMEETSVNSFLYRTRTLSTSRKPGNLSRPIEKSLHPHCGPSCMGFWSSCYLRWIRWSQSFGAGPGALFEQECLLFDEVYRLHLQVSKLKAELDDTIANGTSFSAPDSGMFFTSAPSPGGAREPQDEGTPSSISSFYPYTPIAGFGSRNGDPNASCLRGASVFNFKTQTRQQTKHTRSPSDISFSTPSGDEGTSFSAASGAASLDSSVNSLEAANPSEEVPNKQQTTPTKGHHPKKALMPPKDRITYISSV